MLNIYRSRESIDKEKFIYERIKEDLSKSEKFSRHTFVVVPDQYTLAAERQAMDRMATDVLFDVEIIGISRLGSKILDEVGSPAGTVINKYGRHMIISRILRELEEELLAFKGFDTKETFVRAINDFISAAKQHGVTPGSLMMLSNAVSMKKSPGEIEDGGNIFVRKLRDLSLILARYQESLKGKYTDKEDLLDLYIEGISKSELIKESAIWIYGFDSYTPKNVDFILALAGRAREVNLHLIHDSECRDEDLFGLSQRMTEVFSRFAEYSNIEVKVRDIKNEDIPEDKSEDKTPRAKGLITLEKELYAVSRSKEEDCSGIEIVRCSNMYSEAEAAASYVLKLLREEDYRLSDIVIICNDQEKRGAVIDRAFNEYGLNVFDDKKRNALNSTVSVYILSLLDILAYKYRAGDVMRFLKTGLTGIPNEEIDELENYAHKYGIKGSVWNAPFTRGSHERRYEVKPDGRSLLEEIELTRVKLFSLIEGAKDAFGRAETYREFATEYLASLEKSGLPDRIEELIQRQERAGLLEEAESSAQIWEVIQGLLEQIAEIMDDAPFDGVEFAKLLRSGLSELEIGVLPPSPDDILLGTMQRTRSGDCRAMLIIGANENLIPRSGEEDLLFSPEELEVLAADDQDLGLMSSLRLMEENLAIYRNLSKPKEHLWISYALTDSKGDNISPSEIIKSIHEIFPDLREKEYPLNSEGEDETRGILELLGGKENTLRRYTEEKRGKEGPFSDKTIWDAVEDWLSETDDEILKRVNRALSFKNIQNPLPAELASGLYSKYVNSAGEYIYKLSPTSLEKYSRCPFSYFLDYGLRPDELRTDEVGARDIGELYHSTLQRFTEIVGESPEGWNRIEREESDALIEKLAGEWADEYRSELFKKSGSETYRFNRALKACKFIAWTLVQQARMGEIKESYFETPFGAGSTEDSESGFKLAPIIKDIPGGKAFIQGKIDRIDILPDDRVKIIDYKTGKESLNLEEVKGGYRLQLMLYLQAAQDEIRKPGGVFYFLISEPEMNLAGSKSQEDENEDERLKEIEKDLMKTYRMDGIMVDDDSVIKGIAGDLFDESGEPISSATSNVVKLKRKKDGGLDTNSRKRLLTEEEFGELQNTVDMITTKICKDISSGKIDLRPMKSGKKTPCDFCGYKSICRFDTIFPGCRYEVIR